MRRSFSIAAVFRHAFQLGFRRAPVLVTLGALSQVPAIVYLAGDSVELDAPGASIQILTLMVSMLMLGAVSYTTIVELKGGRSSFFKSVHVALSEMFPILAMGGLLGFFPMVISYKGDLLAALLLPWLILATLLYPAVPIVVAEQGGFRYSLARSAQLTRGRRWRLLAILILLGVGKIVATDLVDRLVGADQDTAIIVAYLLIDLLVEVFAAVVAAVSYFALVDSFAEE